MFRKSVIFLLSLFVLQAVVLVAQNTPPAPAQGNSSITGMVTDQLDGSIPNATVTLTGPDKKVLTAVTDGVGNFIIKNLAPGLYKLRVSAQSFAELDVTDVVIVAGQSKKLTLKLNLESETKVTVTDVAQTIDTDPENNKTATIIQDKDLEALPDDPDDLAAALTALAGPSAGPNGAQIYVDGFTGGQYLPDKNSIKQIIINQNPSSSEYERIGFGRIEIITKPGFGKIHGQIAYNYNGDVLNAENPFAKSKPNYTRQNLETNLSGPLIKDKVSFFIGYNRRDITDVAVVDARTLDSAFNIIDFSQSITQPKVLWSTNSRLDWQVDKNNTFGVRFTYNSNNLENQGIGGFSLASRASNSQN